MREHQRTSKYTNIEAKFLKKIGTPCFEKLLLSYIRKMFGDELKGFNADLHWGSS